MSDLSNRQEDIENDRERQMRAAANAASSEVFKDLLKIAGIEKYSFNAIVPDVYSSSLVRSISNSIYQTLEKFIPAKESQEVNNIIAIMADSKRFEERKNAIDGIVYYFLECYPSDSLNVLIGDINNIYRQWSTPQHQAGKKLVEAQNLRSNTAGSKINNPES